jgi:hypothetical protein
MAGGVFEFDDHGALAKLALNLTKAGPIVGARAIGLVHQFGVVLQARVKANAMGRPGPRAPTGDYNRSINLTLAQRGMTVEAQVGTNLPQGRRLEFGFVGQDSLGRTYHQPPYPHFGPAVDKTAPEFETAVAQIATSTVAQAMAGIAVPAPLTASSPSGPIRGADGRFVSKGT